MLFRCLQLCKYLLNLTPQATSGSANNPFFRFHPAMLKTLKSDWRLVVIATRNSLRFPSCALDVESPSVHVVIDEIPQTTTKTTPTTTLIRLFSGESRLSMHADVVSLKSQRKRSPRALIGRQKLIVESDQQQNVHFDQLKKSWAIQLKSSYSPSNVTTDSMADSKPKNTFTSASIVKGIL